MTNIVKLMMVTALTTVSVMSAFVESAEALFKVGNSYFRTGQDQTNANAQFDLVNTARDDNFIFDQRPGNKRVGLFIGAVENYIEGAGSLDFNSSGNPFLTDPLRNADKLFDVGNLRAELVKNDPIFGGSTINYSIFKPGVTFIPPNDRGPSKRLKNLSYTLLLGPNRDRSFGSFPDNFDERRAVNDLTYIIENNLLVLTIPSDLGNEGSPEIVSRGRIEEIPEPNTISASLTPLLILVAALLMKGRMKTK